MSPTSVFVGRLDESEAFSRAADAYAKALDAGTASRDLPHENVLVFHGKGGMGKSRLLNRLRAWTDGEGRPAGWAVDPLPGRPRRRTTAYNLAGGLDVDVLLHRLRFTADELGIDTPAFDIGLLTRWSLMNPIAKLPDLDRGRHADVWSLVKAGATAALAPLNVIPGVADLAVEKAKAMIETIRSERHRAKLLAVCPGLLDALEELADEDNVFGAAALAALLDWDLHSARGKEPHPCLIVLLDTFERVQSDTRFQEAALNRIVHDTPRLLWVIAGRHRVQWADAPRGSYDHEGADVWPALAESSTKPAQVRLGDLSQDQVVELVRQALPAGRRSRAPEDLPTEAIWAAAGGYPITLDLAIRRAAKLLESDEPVDEERLGSSFPGILTKVANDLSAPGRRALNAGSLVRAFDAPLLDVGAQFMPGEGDGDRFVKQPLVEPSNEPWLPYSIHGIVRQAVRDAPVGLDGAWAEAGWTAAGTRMLEALHTRWRDEQDPEARLALVGAAFDISAELGKSVVWLIDAAIAHGNKDRLIATVEGRTPSHLKAPWSRAFEQFVAAWASPDPATRAERFGAVAKLRGGGRSIRRYATRCRAYELRTQGLHVDAERIFAELRAEDRGDTPLLKYQHALTLVHLGRLRDADALCRELAGVAEPTERVRSFVTRLQGELSLQHGDLRASAEASEARAKFFKGTKNEYNEKEVRTAEARRKALLGDPEALTLAEALIAWTDKNGALSLLRSALCAKAICFAGCEEAAPLIRRSLAIGGKLGPGGVSNHEAVALIFDAAVRPEPEAMSSAIELVAGSPGERDTRWSRPLAWWQAMALGNPLPSYEATVQWIEPEATVIDNWKRVVAERVARLQESSGAHAADD